MVKTEWSFERITKYIEDATQEDLHLEYKACDSLRGKNYQQGQKPNVDVEELTKDVSAFANADGGVIIYGICEGTGNQKHIPTHVDQGFARSEKISSIWLEDKIQMNLSPRIQGLRIFDIAVDDDHFVLVLDIPQSQYGPHMAKDHKYYKRRETKSEAMDHYEVEDVRNRSRGPLLKLNIDFHRTEEIPGGIRRVFYSSGDQVPLDIQIENLVEKPAEYAAVTFYLDSQLQVRSSDIVHGAEFHKTGEIYSKDLGLEIEHGGCLFSRYYASVGLPKASPVWKGNPLPLVGVRLQIPELNKWSENFYFGWEISAPHMPIQQQFYWMNLKRETGQHVSIYGVGEQ